jgi:hypothetical protein
LKFRKEACRFRRAIRAERLKRAPDTGPHAMVRLLSRVIGIGIVVLRTRTGKSLYPVKDGDLRTATQAAAAAQGWGAAIIER